MCASHDDSPKGSKGSKGSKGGPRKGSNVVAEFFSNWREFDGSTGEKIGLTFKNRLRALKGGCCGHHGEPGC